LSAPKRPMPSLRFSRVGRNLDFLPGIDIAQIVIAFIVLLFSLTVHETAHAWTADQLGDPTARLLGRVSLNPIVHADLIGTIIFPLVSMVCWVRAVESVQRLTRPEIPGVGAADALMPVEYEQVGHTALSSVYCEPSQ